MLRRCDHALCVCLTGVTFPPVEEPIAFLLREYTPAVTKDTDPPTFALLVCGVSAAVVN